MSNRVKISKEQLENEFTILNHPLNINHEYYINDLGQVVSKFSLTLLGRLKEGCYAQAHLKYGIGNVYIHRLNYIHNNNGTPIPYGMEIDHIDQDKSNNHISNLRLSTVSQNRKNKTYNMNTIIKKKVPIIACSNTHIFNFLSISDASRSLGISQGLISMNIMKKKYYDNCIALDGSRYQFTKLFD